MKICFASHASDLSGACNSMLNLISELKKKNVDVCVILPRHGIIEKKLIEMDVRYYIVKSYSKIIRVNQRKNIFKTLVKTIYNYFSKVKIKQILKKEKPDLVHINNLTHYVTAVAANDLNIKYVWHLREFLDEDIGFKFTNTNQMTKLIRNSAAKIAISKCIKEKFKKIYDEKNMYVIYNGIPVEDYQSYKEPDVLFKNEINICIIGRISRGKGQLVAIKAINELVKKYNNIKLYIIGSPGYDTEYYNKLKSFVDENKIHDNIQFVSFTTELKQYRDICHINLVCSKKEAFGRVTVEAMLANQMVIASNTGCNIELIDERHNGILFNEGDYKDLSEKIDYAISNEDLCKNIIKNAKIEAVEKYNIKNTANNIYNLYNELLGNI